MNPLNKLMLAAAGLLVVLAPQSNVNAQGNPPAPAGAGVPLTLTIKATAVAPSANSGNSNDNGTTTKTTYSAAKTNFTSGTIIQQIATASGNTFSATAKLIYVGGSVEIEDGSNNIVDASSYLTITLDPDGTGVWSGSDESNDNTGADTQKFSGSYLLTIQYDDGNGDTFTVSGLAKETYSGGIDGNSNPTRASDLFMVSFSGEGTLSSGPSVVVSGTMKGSGKGIPE